MGQEQSSINDQQPPSKGALSQFCCNSNLCNNDTNIDNRMTEVNRRQQKGSYRMMIAGHSRESRLNDGSVGSMVGIDPNQQAYNSNGELGQVAQSNAAHDKKVYSMRDDFAHSVPSSSTGGFGVENKHLQQQNTPHIRDQVKNALNNQSQRLSNLKSDNNSSPDFQAQSTMTISPQSQLQNDIQNSAEAMIEYKKKLQNIVENGTYPSLELQVVSSATLQKGQNIYVNPLGLCAQNQRSLRDISQEGIPIPEDQHLATQFIASLAPDGYTYFGSLPDVYPDDEDQMYHDEDVQAAQRQNLQSIVVNDFIIPSRNPQSAEQHRGRHFQIWFDTQQDSLGYYIKDLGIGFGVFKKMDVYGLTHDQTTGSIQLRDNMLINVGEAYIVVNLLPEGADEDEVHDTLKLKIFGGANNGDIYQYHIDQMENGHKTITLGRTNECDVQINDKLLSKNQCYIKTEFYQDGSYRWVLYDGVNGIPSTNGTWLYINEDMQMYNGMVFKANQTIFNVNLVQ